MQTALHFCGAKIAWPLSWASGGCCLSYQPVLSEKLSFAACVTYTGALNSSLKKSSISISNRVSSRVKSSSCDGGRIVDVIKKNEIESQSFQGNEKRLSCVMKFGGSSVASAERMREVADLILSFPKERPVIVLSAMGKTTNKLLQAGEKAVSCAHLEELEQLLKGIAIDEELNLRTRDYLVSFGECMCTRIFAGYLNKIGVKACQYDAFEIGFMTTDDFTNAVILEETYPTVAKRINDDWICNSAVPIVTGFLGKGLRSGAVTTLGRGGSDLTATAIGKALEVREIQVWKDVDGILTCDPNTYPSAKLVPHLIFYEAVELANSGAQVLHPEAMRPAMEADIPIRVKNSFNPNAPGTLITRTRDMSEAVLTGIVLKRNVTMLDIVSTRMLGQVGFLAKVSSTFEDLGISVDSIATTEELDHVVEELEKIAVVKLKNRTILSLVGNAQRSSLILEKAFHVLGTNGINVKMISQGESKDNIANISLIINDDEAEQCVAALHQAFFEGPASPN
ncbi:hypothetical protein FEM48_Zijuj10G0157700 [Ziziphus jujuba var. spinosa]|uniref:Aspartokinase n=1 Tax=Ziziphus jujuba var. spinosa TaxID=714518 RepID=A0A978UP99_ZIZJJ|nr:hypothetical protein FEM48_Zijuj10G0157700 [Ziziphus jujuba var. spinosa]